MLTDANVKRVIARKNIVNAFRLEFCAIRTSANVVIARILWKNWKTDRETTNFCRTLKNSTNILIDVT